MKKDRSIDIKRLMKLKRVSADALARELKVTTATVYNLRKGKASEQLSDYALIVLEKLEN